MEIVGCGEHYAAFFVFDRLLRARIGFHDVPVLFGPATETDGVLFRIAVPAVILAAFNAVLVIGPPFFCTEGRHGFSLRIFLRTS